MGRPRKTRRALRIGEVSELSIAKKEAARKYAREYYRRTHPVKAKADKPVKEEKPKGKPGRPRKHAESPKMIKRSFDVKVKNGETDGKIPVRLDGKTVIYVRPGKNINAVVSRYQSRNINHLGI